MVQNDEDLRSMLTSNKPEKSTSFLLKVGRLRSEEGFERDEVERERRDECLVLSKTPDAIVDHSSVRASLHNKAHSEPRLSSQNRATISSAVNQSHTPVHSRLDTVNQSDLSARSRLDEYFTEKALPKRMIVNEPIVLSDEERNEWTTPSQVDGTQFVGRSLTTPRRDGSVGGRASWALQRSSVRRKISIKQKPLTQTARQSTATGGGAGGGGGSGAEAELSWESIAASRMHADAGQKTAAEKLAEPSKESDTTLKKQVEPVITRTIDGGDQSAPVSPLPTEVDSPSTTTLPDTIPPGTLETTESTSKPAVKIKRISWLPSDNEDKVTSQKHKAMENAVTDKSFTHSNLLSSMEAVHTRISHNSIPISERRVGNIIKLDGIVNEEMLEMRGNEVIKLNVTVNADAMRSTGTPQRQLITAPKKLASPKKPAVLSVQDNSVSSTDSTAGVKNSRRMGRTRRPSSIASAVINIDDDVNENRNTFENLIINVENDEVAAKDDVEMINDKEPVTIFEKSGKEGKHRKKKEKKQRKGKDEGEDDGGKSKKSKKKKDDKKVKVASGHKSKKKKKKKKKKKSSKHEKHEEESAPKPELPPEFSVADHVKPTQEEEKEIAEEQLMNDDVGLTHVDQPDEEVGELPVEIERMQEDDQTMQEEDNLLQEEELLLGKETSGIVEDVVMEEAVGEPTTEEMKIAEDLTVDSVESVEGKVANQDVNWEVEIPDERAEINETVQQKEDNGGFSVATTTLPFLEEIPGEKDAATLPDDFVQAADVSVHVSEAQIDALIQLVTNKEPDAVSSDVKKTGTNEPDVGSEIYEPEGLKYEDGPVNRQDYIGLKSPIRKGRMIPAMKEETSVKEEKLEIKPAKEEKPVVGSTALKDITKQVDKSALDTLERTHEQLPSLPAEDGAFTLSQIISVNYDIPEMPFERKKPAEKSPIDKPKVKLQERTHSGKSESDISPVRKKVSEKNSKRSPEREEPTPKRPAEVKANTKRVKVKIEPVSPERPTKQLKKVQANKQIVAKKTKHTIDEKPTPTRKDILKATQELKEAISSKTSKQALAKSAAILKKKVVAKAEKADTTGKKKVSKHGKLKQLVTTTFPKESAEAQKLKQFLDSKKDVSKSKKLRADFVAKLKQAQKVSAAKQAGKKDGSRRGSTTTAKKVSIPDISETVKQFVVADMLKKKGAASPTGTARRETGKKRPVSVSAKLSRAQQLQKKLAATTLSTTATHGSTGKLLTKAEKDRLLRQKLKQTKVQRKRGRSSSSSSSSSSGSSSSSSSDDSSSSSSSSESDSDSSDSSSSGSSSSSSSSSDDQAQRRKLLKKVAQAKKPASALAKLTTASAVTKKAATQPEKVKAQSKKSMLEKSSKLEVARKVPSADAAMKKVDVVAKPKPTDTSVAEKAAVAAAAAKAFDAKLLSSNPVADANKLFVSTRARDRSLSLEASSGIDNSSDDEKAVDKNKKITKDPVRKPVSSAVPNMKALEKLGPPPPPPLPTDDKQLKLLNRKSLPMPPTIPEKSKSDKLLQAPKKEEPRKSSVPSADKEVNYKVELELPTAPTSEAGKKKYARQGSNVLPRMPIYRDGEGREYFAEDFELSGGEGAAATVASPVKQPVVAKALPTKEAKPDERSATSVIVPPAPSTTMTTNAATTPATTPAPAKQEEINVSSASSSPASPRQRTSRTQQQVRTQAHDRRSHSSTQPPEKRSQPSAQHPERKSQSSTQPPDWRSRSSAELQNARAQAERSRRSRQQQPPPSSSSESSSDSDSTDSELEYIAKRISDQKKLEQARYAASAKANLIRSQSHRKSSSSRVPRDSKSHHHTSSSSSSRKRRSGEHADDDSKYSKRSSRHAAPVAAANAAVAAAAALKSEFWPPLTSQAQPQQHQLQQTLTRQPQPQQMHQYLQPTAHVQQQQITPQIATQAPQLQAGFPTNLQQQRAAMRFIPNIGLQQIPQQPLGAMHQNLLPQQMLMLNQQRVSGPAIIRR